MGFRPDVKIQEPEIQFTLHDTITTLTQRMAEHDPLLYKHALRVQYLAYRMTSSLQLTPEETFTIELAALLHDLGKLEIQATILYKTSPLTPDEFEMIKQHCVQGAILLSKFPIIQQIIPLVLHHHERWDGGGYPLGLKQKEIPLGARIIAVVDAFEAMLSVRAYQGRRTLPEALVELQDCAGTQFDPLLVEHFCTVIAHTLHNLF